MNEVGLDRLCSRRSGKDRPYYHARNAARSRKYMALSAIEGSPHKGPLVGWLLVEQVKIAPCSGSNEAISDE